MNKQPIPVRLVRNSVQQAVAHVIHKADLEGLYQGKVVRVVDAHDTQHVGCVLGVKGRRVTFTHDAWIKSQRKKREAIQADLQWEAKGQGDHEASHDGFRVHVQLNEADAWCKNRRDNSQQYYVVRVYGRGNELLERQQVARQLHIAKDVAARMLADEVVPYE